MNRRSTLRILLCNAALAWAVPANCWGPEGHRIVGAEALTRLDGTARAAVVEILGSDSVAAIDEACSWPDAVHETAEWEWSEPQHYVNIPRSAHHYDRQRDCPDNLCVTEAIGRYANELSRKEITGKQRWQAFAWLCHLVGDLHQPLHAGYRDDRGGNYVEIEFKGEFHNLHQFWDRALIQDRLGSADAWDRPYQEHVEPKTGNIWKPETVNAWTDESHQLVARYAYPPASGIDAAFAEQSWLVTRQQWQKASRRLARVLNAVLGERTID